MADYFAERVGGDGEYRGPDTLYRVGKIEFTNAQGVQAINNFHQLYQQTTLADRLQEDFVEGMMGGCLAAAAGWDDGFIDGLEHDEEGSRNLFEICVRLLNTWAHGIQVGVYVLPNAGLS